MISRREVRSVVEIEREGVWFFNDKPKKAIEWLIEKEFLRSDPVDVANWLFATADLDKVKLGEYLTEP